MPYRTAAPSSSANDDDAWEFGSDDVVLELDVRAVAPPISIERARKHLVLMLLTSLVASAVGIYLTRDHGSGSAPRERYEPFPLGALAR